MSLASSGRAALAALALLTTALPAARPDTITLTSPVTATCVTDDRAVFTVVDGALHPLEGRFMIFPPGASGLRVTASLPKDGEPGELLRVRAVSEEPLDSLSVQLSTGAKGVVARAYGFQVNPKEAPEEWAALLGIPPTLTDGACFITLSGSSGRRSFLQLQRFLVSPRRFYSETIPLTDALTDLATVPDKEKTRESQILARVLSTPHPDAIYETGELLVPLAGARRTAGYGDRREYDYANGARGHSVHLGVDIASPPGTPVPSSGRGRVVFAAHRILTGNTIIIEHLPGLFTVYYHLSSISVKSGQIVERGELIGQVGMTGFATGPHLHWEVEDMGVPVDPDEAASAPLLDKPGDFLDIGQASGTEGR